MNNRGEEFYIEICEEYLKDVYDFCRFLTKNSEELRYMAEEGTQETFVRAKLQIETLQKHPNIKGWLYVTARNIVNQLFREYYIRTKKQVPIHDEIIIVDVGIEGEIENIIENKIDIDKVKKIVLEQLSKEEYKFYEDLFIKKTRPVDIAKRYNISISAIYTRTNRLKIKIKKIAKQSIEEEKTISFNKI